LTHADIVEVIQLRRAYKQETARLELQHLQKERAKAIVLGLEQGQDWRAQNVAGQDWTKDPTAHLDLNLFEREQGFDGRYGNCY